MTKPTRLSSREALIEAAFTVFSRDPSAPLAQVVERAGVGRATLHRHFASRDELVRALARIAIEEMDLAAEAACEGTRSSLEALERMLHALIPLGNRHGFLALEPLDQDPAIRAEFERQQRETREMVDAAKREGAFDTSLPTSWIVQAYDYLLYAAWESVRTEDATPARAAELAWRTLISGLGGPSHDGR